MLPRYLLLALLLSTSVPAQDDHVKSIETWRAARVARLTAPDSWLTLVGRHLIAPGENTVGTAPDNSIRLAVGPPSLATVTLAADRTVTEHLFSWVPVDSLQVEFGLQLDQLSMCFVLLITGVGSLIHIYSVGYMAHDAGRRKFFAYLNLFVASMLLLVLANNYLLLYVGWEGVGLASYLLIGYWYHKPSACAAAISLASSCGCSGKVIVTARPSFSFHVTSSRPPPNRPPLPITIE